MPRKQPPRDPNLDHPAVKLYIDICHSSPNHVQREAIVALVTKLDLYEQILRKFMLEGQPPHKVNWTLERYQKALPTEVGRGTGKAVKGETFPISPGEEEWIRTRAGR